MPRRARTLKPRPAPAAPRVRSGRDRRWSWAGLACLIAALAAWAIANRPAPPSRREAAWSQAREALASGRARAAEEALARASALDSGDPEPWLLRLEMLRVRDRQAEAQRLGWEALAKVRGAEGRRQVLRAMTLALLADTPDDLARETLARWVAADPGDLDARAALLLRAAASPRAGDPDRGTRVALLSEAVASHPENSNAREALILSLADSGDPARGRAALDAWPEADRDARFFRLAGRWHLEFERRPADAVADFARALAELPHDWRTRARLARALKAAGRDADSRREAESVARLREALDPATLGTRLDADLAALDDPKSRLDLADLCRRAGLSKLADAWTADAQAVARPPL